MDALKIDHHGQVSVLGEHSCSFLTAYGRTFRTRFLKAVDRQLSSRVDLTLEDHLQSLWKETHRCAKRLEALVVASTQEAERIGGEDSSERALS